MKIVSALAVALVLLVVAAWATAPDPRFNPASFEADPLVPTLAPAEEAITLAQYRDGEGARQTMVVLAVADGIVSGIDLRALGAARGEDPFAALAAADLGSVRAGTTAGLATVSMPVAALLPSGPDGQQHIGTGTNFPEHAEEANSGSVFQFPKFGAATPARTEVRAEPGVLLDYEVELCVRFDRDIASLADFDAAAKGVFLCGDFTNRNALIELADPDDLDSGRGFSDAKSGPDFFPTGPFLVVPDELAGFVEGVRMTTELNGAARQDARGREMTLDFRQLTEKALADMSAPRFLYRDRFYRLAPERRIAKSATLMSGTAEGTIFTPPTRADIIEGLWDYAATGGPVGSRDVMTAIRRRFIANELAGRHYLQPGDRLVHRSNHLGDIEVLVRD